MSYINIGFILSLIVITQLVARSKYIKNKTVKNVLLTISDLALCALIILMMVYDKYH